MWKWTSVLAATSLIAACSGSSDNGSLPTSASETSGSEGTGGGFGFGANGSNATGDTGGATGTTEAATGPGGTDGSDDPDKPDGPVVSQWDDLDPECGYGTVYGLICSHTEQTFVNGASVWIEAEDCAGNLINRQTISDEDGYYTLDAVPNGLQTVHVKRDDFEKSYTVQVNDDMVSDITAVAHKECFQVVDPPECIGGLDNIPVEATTVTGLADVVIFIDTSGSMDDETAWMQQNLNSFANYIGGAAIDFRVILIGDNKLCVPTPLGGPGCTDSENFRHVAANVGSNDGLEIVQKRYGDYSDFLREGATTNFVAVTDDNSDKSASWFTSFVNGAQNPGFSSDWLFHSIVAMGPIPIVGCFGGAFGGLTYIELSDNTGGAKFPICETDWSSMWSELAETVVDTVQATCVYDLPSLEAAGTADSVTVTWFSGAQSEEVPHVPGANACGGGGWYFDNDAGPSQLIVCESTCSQFTGGALQVSYGCEED